MWASPFPMSPSHLAAATSQERLNTPFPTPQSMDNPWGQAEAVAMHKNCMITPSPSITHTLLSIPLKP